MGQFGVTLAEAAQFKISDHSIISQIFGLVYSLSLGATMYLVFSMFPQTQLY